MVWSIRTRMPVVQAFSFFGEFLLGLMVIREESGVGHNLVNGEFKSTNSSPSPLLVSLTVPLVELA